MALSTRDFMMKNDQNVLKSSNPCSWDEDTNPSNPFQDVVKSDGFKFGKSWSERMDDDEKEKDKKSQRNDRYFSDSSKTDLNKENCLRANKYVEKPLETDKRKLQTRQRQIDIGKETTGYSRYMKEIRRKDRTQDHPRTPNKYTVCSTRSWQGTVRVWRRKLHYWDTLDEQKSHQKKFANILTSPYMFDDENSNDEEDRPRRRRINNSIDNEDCISEGSSQNSTEDNDSHLLNDEPISESTLFWTGI